MQATQLVDADMASLDYCWPLAGFTSWEQAILKCNCKMLQVLFGLYHYFIFKRIVLPWYSHGYSHRISIDIIRPSLFSMIFPHIFSWLPGHPWPSVAIPGRPLGSRPFLLQWLGAQGHPGQMCEIDWNSCRELLVTSHFFGMFGCSSLPSGKLT